jgi:WD40 repeat protein
VVTGGADGQLILWNVDTGQVLRRFRGHTAPIFDISVSEDGSLLASTAGDHLLRIWLIQSGKELAKLASFLNGSTMVADADGRFDASDPNSNPGIRWFMDERPIEASRAKLLFYTPHLLARIIGGEKLPALDYSSLAKR